MEWLLDRGWQYNRTEHVIFDRHTHTYTYISLMFIIINVHHHYLITKYNQGQVSIGGPVTTVEWPLDRGHQYQWTAQKLRCVAVSHLHISMSLRSDLLNDVTDAPGQRVVKML